jgi:hypothetical protein
MLPTAADVQAKIDQLRALSTQFEATLAKLASLENVARMRDDAWQRWNALISNGVNVRASIQKGTNAIRDALQWLRDTTGISVSGLGFAPIAIALVLAAIVAAIAAASSFVADAQVEIRKLEILQASVAELPPEQRAKILQDAANRAPVSFTGNLASIAMYAAIGLLAIFVLPKLLERK